MTNIAVILSGCGIFDGSEIHESVSALIALNQAGVDYQCVAPNMTQTQVINHLTKEPTDEIRHVLIEAGRIARGNIKDISTVNVDDFDAAIYPGGVGAAANLSDFSSKGAACQVQNDVLAFAQAMAKANKPQGFICIAPTLISRIYTSSVQHTIGNDTETAAAITAMGGTHVNCTVSNTVVDQTHNVVSTPAYMLADGPAQVFAGVSKLVADVLSLIIK